MGHRLGWTPRAGKGEAGGARGVPETGGEHHGGQGGTGIKKPAQGSGWWLSGSRYLTHLPYSRGRCHNIGLEVTHASEACLLLGQRDDGSDEIDAPGPLGPFMFHGWARTTRLKVWPQIWAACVHPTMTTSIPSLIRSSPSPLGVPPSLLLPEHRPLTETTPQNQTIPANGGRRNGYKTRTSHPSWLSPLDNHSTREQAPFKGSVASWVAVVLFEPNLQPPTSNPHTTHTHTHTSHQAPRSKATMPHSVRATNLNAAVSITTTTTTTTTTALATTTTTIRIRTPVPPSPMLADWSRAQDRSSITFAEILLAGATAAKWATPLPSSPYPRANCDPRILFSRSASADASFGRNPSP